MKMNLVQIDERDRKIDALEVAIKSDLAPVECPIAHYFAPGLYAREMRIPAGTVLTGKIHKFDNFSIMSAGKLKLFMEDGSTSVVQAPFAYVAPAGTRRAALALEDTVWTVMHATTENDVAEIEKQVVFKNAKDYREFIEQQQNLEINMEKQEVAP